MRVYLLVGPPGVGKTAAGRLVAERLNRHAPGSARLEELDAHVARPIPPPDLAPRELQKKLALLHQAALAARLKEIAGEAAPPTALLVAVGQGALAPPDLAIAWLRDCAFKKMRLVFMRGRAGTCFDRRMADPDPSDPPDWATHQEAFTTERQQVYGLAIGKAKGRALETEFLTTPEATAEALHALIGSWGG